MAAKCIAIGNRIMGDDGIGIKIAEVLSPFLARAHIELIYGETDSEYALSKIQNGDVLFVIDSTFFGVKPGTVSYIPIGKARCHHNEVFSQHQPNLLYLLKTYEKTVEGYIIGIEIAKIDFSLELSNILNTRFLSICEEVYLFIDQTIRGLSKYPRN